MSFDVSPPQPLNQPAQGPPAPPGMGNQPSRTGGWTLPTTAPAGAQDSDVVSADAVMTDARNSVATAYAAMQAASEQFNRAQAAASNIADPSAQEQLRAAAQVLDNAQRAWANANTALDNAGSRVAAASLQAASRADKTSVQAQYYQAHANEADALAQKARVDAEIAKNTSAAQVGLLTAQAADANARAQAVGILTPAQAAQANAEAGKTAAETAQINALLPFVTQRAAGEAAITSATAALAPQQAQASYDKARADADTARLDYNQKLAEFNATTDEDRKRAVQIELNQKQAALDTANQNLEQARRLMPIAVEQAGANVAATQAGTAATLAGVQKGTLGPLYGIGDQISRYRDLIASGQITPQDADTALNSYLNQQVSGATPYQWAQEQNRVAQERLNTAQAFASNTLGTFNQLAAAAGPGHGAELAAGYQAALNLGRQFFGQMGGFGPAGAPPSGEAPPASSAPVVHINIGGGQPTSAPQPSMPQPAMPATPPPLPAPVAAAAPVPATGGGSDWLAALQARQAADVQAQRAAAGVTAPAGGGGEQNGGDQESNRQTTPFSGDDVDQAWAGSGVRTDDGSTL